MADPFVNFSRTASGPGRRAVAVVPSDTTDLAETPQWLYVGTGGTIVMVGVDAPAGATGLSWLNVLAGDKVPFSPRRIMATGTTASNILAIYA